MDINLIIATVLSFIGGIGAVTTFAGKYLPVTKKYISIASDAIDLLKTVLNASQPDADGKVTFTADEIANIRQAASKLEADFKK